MQNTCRALFLSAALLAVGACSSTTSNSSDATDGTTTSSVAGETTSTATGDTSVTTSSLATPTTAVATTVAVTVASTNVPATNPPVTGPTVVNSSIKLSGPCPPPPTTGSPDVSFHPVTSAPPPDPVVQMSWKALGADSVYVAIDNRDGPYTVGLPLQGSIELPYQCGSGAHKYYIVAVKGADYATGQKDYKSQTITG